ncbi:hypothetical protein GCM10010329_64860 [Streptomyces spiroverticillatus]|uniref:Uncharacterized protein n=1 Tax=Streptomyces finlayi TaxID=67296 RepID=A0A918X4C9_9ACTN|nr:hypothetical protein [Streptomyces finlayi]GHA32528.1 hypothetical protein GCM10010329_64860 [Streptomyces spiroverticillatus]GHD10520.1 hypothetical protein GCM10010334_65700 [Streptomyces finlayi]
MDIPPDARGRHRLLAHSCRYAPGTGWLAVPHVDLLSPPGLHWAVAPNTPGRLCDLVAVAQMVAVGAARLSEKQ